MGNWADYTWIIVVGSLAAFFTAFGIGANDVANAFGSSVAARTLTMRQALLIAAVCEFSGAVLLGAEVTLTVSGGIARISAFYSDPEIYMYGMLCALVASGTWLLLATYLSLPVSTTHATIGGVLGFAFVYGGPDAVLWLEPQDSFPYMNGLVPIVLAWFTSPLISGLAAAFLFLLVRSAILRRAMSLELAIWSLPVLVLFTVFINLFFVLYKGSEARRACSSNKCAWISAAAGAGCALLTALVVVPFMRHRIRAAALARSQAAQSRLELATSRPSAAPSALTTATLPRCSTTQLGLNGGNGGSIAGRGGGGGGGSAGRGGGSASRGGSGGGGPTPQPPSTAAVMRVHNPLASGRGGYSIARSFSRSTARISESSQPSGSGALEAVKAAALPPIQPLLAANRDGSLPAPLESVPESSVHTNAHPDVPQPQPQPQPAAAAAAAAAALRQPEGPGPGPGPAGPSLREQGATADGSLSPLVKPAIAAAAEEGRELGLGRAEGGDGDWGLSPPNDVTADDNSVDRTVHRGRSGDGCAATDAATAAGGNTAPACAAADGEPTPPLPSPLPGGKEPLPPPLQQGQQHHQQWHGHGHHYQAQPQQQWQWQQPGVFPHPYHHPVHQPAPDGAGGLWNHHQQQQQQQQQQQLLLQQMHHQHIQQQQQLVIHHQHYENLGELQGQPAAAVAAQHWQVGIEGGGVAWQQQGQQQQWQQQQVWQMQQMQLQQQQQLQQWQWQQQQMKHMQLQQHTLLQAHLEGSGRAEGGSSAAVAVATATTAAVAATGAATTAATNAGDATDWTAGATPGGLMQTKRAVAESLERTSQQQQQQQQRGRQSFRSHRDGAAAAATAAASTLGNLAAASTAAASRAEGSETSAELSSNPDADAEDEADSSPRHSHHRRSPHPNGNEGEGEGERTSNNAHFQKTFDQLKAIVLHGTNVNVHDCVELGVDPVAVAIHAHAEVFDPSTEHAFKYLQVITAICDSFSHGANDVANSVGPLAAIWFIYRHQSVDIDSNVPVWVLVLGGAGIVVGLAVYGEIAVRHVVPYTIRPGRPFNP
ncbi:hypothetical protein Vafri_20536 [Volvox africanus]|uniref:Phosphate transporter n=1 Tax=Volvox africanus TaxID=51714 RepID=A0A8J4BSL5_9CHLO|nr:hypothetical protein Vafri_20536 [Volvox africanus]